MLTGVHPDDHTHSDEGRARAVEELTRIQSEAGRLIEEAAEDEDADLYVVDNTLQKRLAVQQRTRAGQQTVHDPYRS